MRKSRRRSASRLGFLQQYGIGIDVTTQDTERFAIRRPVEFKDFFGLEVRNLMPRGAIEGLSPEIVHSRDHCREYRPCDVGRLDIAVDDSLGMCSVEYIGYLDARTVSMSNGLPAMRCFRVRPSRNSMTMKGCPCWSSIS